MFSRSLFAGLRFRGLRFGGLRFRELENADLENADLANKDLEDTASQAMLFANRKRLFPRSSPSLPKTGDIGKIFELEGNTSPLRARSTSSR